VLRLLTVNDAVVLLLQLVGHRATFENQQIDGVKHCHAHVGVSELSPMQSDWANTAVVAAPLDQLSRQCEYMCVFVMTGGLRALGWATCPLMGHCLSFKNYYGIVSAAVCTVWMTMGAWQWTAILKYL